MSSVTQAPSGVAAALASAPPARTSFKLFSLLGKVALVTGGHRGIGLELSLALAEAGAVVYCLDLAAKPDDEWLKVQNYAAQLSGMDPNDPNKKGRLEYVNGDVTDQAQMWSIAEDIAKKEGRLDICLANAGILGGGDCLDYSADDFRKVIDVNVNGVFFTAQAAGRQMASLGIHGSIVLTASMSGSITNKDVNSIAYNTSKSAVIQMARSLACELGSKGIRVNSISPGYIYTKMTGFTLNKQPHFEAEWSSQNPLGRLGTPDELRGVALWLASEASSFCTGSDIIVDGGHRAW